MKLRAGNVVWMTVGVFAAVLFLCGQARSDDKAAATYKQKCASCHGADGKGETPAGKATGARSFGSADVTKMSDDELAGIIEKGEKKMPAYGKSLKADEIKSMVAYIRTLGK